MTHSLLLIDDDTAILSALNLLLKASGFSVSMVTSPEAALAWLKQHRAALVLMDMNYSRDTTSGAEGLELLQAIKAAEPLVPVVVMTGWASIELAVAAMQKGAADFVQKPWENQRLVQVIHTQLKLAKTEHQVQKLQAENQLLRSQQHTDIVAESASMQQLLQLIKQLGDSDVNLLLTGSHGTGKSTLARYIHQQSRRRQQAFIELNMGAVPESLFESELFGHVKGAFTDARESRMGRFELADAGTLFLDEIGTTPLSQQPKLLRVLESQQFEPVGSSRTQSVNVRLISATNADLKQLVKDGQFRQDLLYRLNTVEIRLPDLAQRTEDIWPLFQQFCQQYAAQYQKELPVLSAKEQQQLLAYDWPGNVRELSQVAQRLVLFGSLELMLTRGAAAEVHQYADDLTLEAIELQVISQRLRQYAGNANAAAQSLGLSRSAFYRRLEKNK